MRLYWEIARRGFRRYATYRTATFAGAFTNTVFGVLRAYIILAVFTQRTHVGGFTAPDAVRMSLVGLSAFWLLDERGANQLMTTLLLLLSGMILPLQFFPDWLERIARVLPFASVVQIPMEVFVEKHGGAGLFGALGLQAAWAVALYVIGAAALAAAT